MAEQRRTTRGVLAGLLLLPGLFAATAASAAVSSRTVNEGGRDLVVIANDALELTFEPARGGRCVKFVFQDNGEQLIDDAPVCGMFIDHWAKYTWPSALMWLPYEYELLKDVDTRIGVRLSVTVPAKGGGKGAASAEAAAKMPTSPDLIGLVVRKTIWLEADNDTILVEHEVHNPTGKSRAVALYVQHLFNMGGSHYHDSWYLPSTRGVVVRLQPDEEGGKTIGPDWVLDPTAGWIAVRDRKTSRGLLFAFDYNYIQRIYTSGESAEWFMDAVPVGPGRSFTCRHVIKPVQDFEDFVHGSEHLVADLRLDEIDGQIRVRHDLAAVRAPLSDLRMSFKVTGWKSKKPIAERSLQLDKLGFDKVRQEFRFKTDELADGVVLRAVVRGPNLKESYEVYYAGDEAEHEARYGWFANPGGALASTRGDAYHRPQPRKAKQIDKPDLAAVPRPDPARYRVLVVFGLYTHILNIDDALATPLADGAPKPEFVWANCPPNAVETFPGTYDELFQFDAVVLSDVNYKALVDIAFEMICDYVEQGGSLLVVGGPYALGNGEFEGQRFLDVLPVTLSGPFDLKWAGKGKSWDLKGVKERHPVLEGVPFAQNPRVFWHHFVKPKPGAEVVLNAGEEPTLILGSYGMGKVAVLTLSPTGLGAEGETQWWDWDGWFPLVKNIFTWLNE